MAMALLLALTTVVSAATVDAPWTGSGPGTTVVVSDGSSAPAEFTYDNPGPFSGAWEFSTTAGAAGTHTVNWTYSGFHSWFQVRVMLDAFVYDGSTTTTVNLVNDGPANCCSSPSGGFSYSGTYTFVVQPGDEYGFQMSGSHFDSARQLKGRLTVDEPNVAPVCSSAVPSSDSLWPPNHKFQSIDVNGVTDADGDAVSINIDSIFQDEAVDAPGTGNTSPDGTGVGTSTASVRAERSGDENGRVYHVSFTADDGNGGSCTGVVQVGVPHDQSGDPAVDDGPNFDSTQE